MEASRSPSSAAAAAAAVAGAGESAVSLSDVRVGSAVRGLRVSLHLSPAAVSAPAVGASSASRSKQSSSKAKASQSKAAFQSKQQAHAAAAAASKWPLALAAPETGRVRCALSDHSASIVADLSAEHIAGIIADASANGDSCSEGVLRVCVDGQIELQAGHLLFTASSVCRASPASSAASTHHGALSSLLNARSHVQHAAGVWLLRLVAGELFALMKMAPAQESAEADQSREPADDDEDDEDAGSADMHPPHQLLRAPWTDDLGGLQHCARDALLSSTSVRDDQFILMSAVRSAPILRSTARANSPQAHTAPDVSLTLFCGLLLPGATLSGDSVEETVLDREHWIHASRAMTELPAEWSESLTQIITSLGSWVDRWTLRMDPDADADDSVGPAHAAQDEELFDSKGRVVKQSNTKIDAAQTTSSSGAGDAQSEAVAVPPLTLTQLLAGMGESSPAYAQQLVRDLNSALASCETSLQALRQKQRDRADEEEEAEEEGQDDDEEDEDGDAKIATADPVPVQQQARRSRGAAPTSAAKLVGGARAKPAAADEAKSRRLRASLRTVLGAIESGQRRRLPVCILTGFLGSGKTSLLNHLLASNHGLRIGVIVNDFSEVNVDAALLHAARPEQLVELSNGCICCTLRADLFTSVVELVATQKIDYICVESTGLGEPAPVAATFTFDLSDADASGAGMQTYGLSSLAQVCQIDCIATVVDALAVYNIISARTTQTQGGEPQQQNGSKSADAAHKTRKTDERTADSSNGNNKKRHKNGTHANAAATAATAVTVAAPASASASSSSSSSPIAATSAAAALSSIRASESSNKSVLSLLIDQLEYCNVLVLNKASMLAPAQLDLVEEFVRLNNVGARCVRADYGRIEPSTILESNLFNQQESLSSPLLSFAAAEWHASLQSRRLNPGAAIASESVEYGISSFVYLRRVGFSAARFHALLAGFSAADPLSCMSGVVRVKGVFWIAERHQAVGVWQATTPGHTSSITPSGAWLLDLSAEDCVTSGRELLSLQSRWHSRVCDRYTQLVFIGAQMDEAAIRRALDDCCLTEQEMDEALTDDEQDDDDEEEDEDDREARVKAEKMEQSKQWPILQPLLAFDADPDAEPTCALKQ